MFSDILAKTNHILIIILVVDDKIGESNKQCLPTSQFKVILHIFNDFLGKRVLKEEEKNGS